MKAFRALLHSSRAHPPSRFVGRRGRKKELPLVTSGLCLSDGPYNDFTLEQLTDYIEWLTGTHVEIMFKIDHAETGILGERVTIIYKTLGNV